MQKINKNMKKMPKTQSIWLKIGKITAWFLIVTIVANFLNIFIAPEVAHAASQVAYPSGDISAAGTWAVFPTSPTTKFDKVDEVGANDGDTSYLTHGTTAGSALFSFSAFSIPAGAIITNLTVTVVARDVTSGKNAVQPAISVNGTNYLTTSTSTEVPTAYTAISYAYTTNPLTPAAWTVADINGTGTRPLQGFGVSSADASPAFRITQVYATVNYTITNTAPTAVLNTPTNGSTIYTDTPDLVSTCTDVNGDTVEYKVQVDTVNTFDSSVSSQTFSRLTTAGYGSWQGVAVNSTNGDVYAVVSGGDIYKQTAGTGTFSPLNATGANQSWYGVAVNSTNGDVYAVVYSGDIYKQTAGTGTFSPLNATGATKYWHGVAVNSSNGDVYAAAGYGDIYKQTAGTGTFSPLNATGANNYWYGVAVNSTNGDVYAAVGAGSNGIYRSPTYGPLLSKFSAIPDATFTDVTNGANTHPFPSGDQVKYTIQPGDALTPGQTYYWRVACIDPSVSNTYGAWSSTYSFIVDASVPTLGEILFLVLIGCAVFIGVKTGVIKLKPTKNEPIDKKPPKDIPPVLPKNNHQGPTSLCELRGTPSVDGITKIPKKDA